MKNKTSRRNMMISVGLIAGLSGCIGDDEEEIKSTDVDKFCSKNCDIIEHVNLDSNRYLFDDNLSYTNVIIKFKEVVSYIKLSVEIYNEGKLVDIKDIEREDTSGIKVEFDGYLTNNLKNINIVVQEWQNSKN